MQDSLEKQPPARDIADGIRRLGEAPRRALARRDPGYFANEARRPWLLGWTAGVSFLGLWVLDWSPASLWVFIMLGFWGGVIQNILKMAVCGRAVNRFYAGHAQDQEVWAVVSALRHDRDPGRVKVPEKNVTPFGLLAIDFGVLTVVSGMMWLMANEREIPLFQEFLQNRQLIILSLLTLAAEAIPPLWQDRCRDENGEPIVKYDAMGPTIIGWVLMFLFAGLATDLDGLTTLIVVVNTLLVIGVPLTAFGYRELVNETEWLEDRLTEMPR